METVEVRIERCRVRITRVDIASARIRLPELDPRAFHWPTLDFENTSHDIAHAHDAPTTQSAVSPTRPYALHDKAGEPAGKQPATAVIAIVSKFMILLPWRAARRLASRIYARSEQRGNSGHVAKKQRGRPLQKAGRATRAAGLRVCRH